MTVRKLEESTLWTVMYLSSDLFHITIVPPIDLDLAIASVGSSLSSELSS